MRRSTGLPAAALPPVFTGCGGGRGGQDSRVVPRMTLAASTDQAMAMADRWDRVFCSTLLALRDLRRFWVTVNIQGPGQVNVGR